MKNRKWFLTINNWNKEEWEKAIKEIENCEYGICCQEVGDECGTPHLHIWLHYKNARSDVSVQKMFPRCWKMPGKGRDCDQSYLKKQDIWKEAGKMEQQGKRNDISKVKEIIKEGGGMIEIINEVDSYQAMRSGELMLKYLETGRKVGKLEINWYWGKPETGKTRKVYDTEVNVFRPLTQKWWEGYDGHKVVLIDELRPYWCSFSRLLVLTDIYPFRVESKGGSRQVQYNKLYITSCFSPTQFFEAICDDTKGDLYQIVRRITNIVCFDTEVKGNNIP